MGYQRRTRRHLRFLTTHARVLLCLAEDPDVRCRDVAARLGITERAVQGVVADLAAHGFVERTRSGRRNHYEVRRHRPLPDQLEGRDVDDLLRTFAEAGG